MKIYTRTGDGGLTSLYSGERVSKSVPTIKLLGQVDHVNSCLGVVVEQYFSKWMKPESIQNVQTPIDRLCFQTAQFLIHTQKRLLDVGSHVATPRVVNDFRSADAAIELSHLARKLLVTQFDTKYVTELEANIDELTSVLPPLTQFILPNNFAHVARTACRMAECSAVKLYSLSNAIDEVIVKYMNRLSDYLFTLARFVSFFASENPDEQQYSKTRELLSPI